MKVSVAQNNERHKKVRDTELETGRSEGGVVAGEVVRLTAARPEYEPVEADVTAFAFCCGCVWGVTFVVYYGIKVFGIHFGGGSEDEARMCSMDAFYGNQLLHLIVAVVTPFAAAGCTVVLILVGSFISTVRDYACPSCCAWLNYEEDDDSSCGIKGGGLLFVLYYPFTVYMAGFVVTTQFALNGPPQARPSSEEFWVNPINCSDGIDPRVYNLAFDAQKTDVVFHLIGAPVMVVILLVRFVWIPYRGTIVVWFKRQRAGCWNWVNRTEDLDLETLEAGIPVEAASPLDDIAQTRKYRKCCCCP